jgi:uncharacterized membrane protein YhaH (DUF805 family)
VSDASLSRRIFAPLGRLLVLDGRAAPADFWPYMLLLIAIYWLGLALASASLPLGIGSPVPFLFGLTPILILLAAAAVVRRLHDVGWSGLWMAAYAVLALIFIGFFFYQRYRLTHEPYDPESLSLFRFMPLLAIFVLAMNGIAILIFILCLLPGTAGPNRYGPEPTGGLPL